MQKLERWEVGKAVAAYRCDIHDKFVLLFFVWPIFFLFSQNTIFSE